MTNLIVYLRITYGLQLLATGNLLFALFLPWHSTVSSPIGVITKLISGVEVPFQVWNQVTPFWLLLLLLPVIIISIIRALMGLFENHRMGLLKVVRRSSYVMLLPIMWFYFSSTEIGGRLQFGYWLTISSAVLLILLIWVESSFPQDKQQVYFECPNCGQANPPKSRRCQHCGRLLFPEV